MTLEPVCTAFLLDVQHYRESVENKPPICLVVRLGKALSGISLSWCGRQMAGNFLSEFVTAHCTFSLLVEQHILST